MEHVTPIREPELEPELLSETSENPSAAARNRTVPPDLQTALQPASPVLTAPELTLPGIGSPVPLKGPILRPFIETMNNFRNDNPPGVTA